VGYGKKLRTDHSSVEIAGFEGKRERDGTKNVLKNS
jgi:hypothetical protein